MYIRLGRTRPGDISKLREQVPKCPCSLLTAVVVPSSFRSTLVASGERSLWSGDREAKPWALFTAGSAQYSGSTWKWLAAGHSLSATSLKGNGEGKYYWGGGAVQMFKKYAWFCILLEWRHKIELYRFLVCGPWLDCMFRDFEDTQLQNLWQRSFSEWMRNVKIFVSYVNAHQRLASAEKDLNHLVDSMTPVLD